MNLVANPTFFKFFMMLLGSVVIIAVGALAFRYLKQMMLQDVDMSSRPAGRESSGFAFHTYQGVISRLKEQEQELKSLREAASSRASASESLSVAVLTNLGSGVVVFNPAGIVQQANPAAREILGYASPTGLHTRDLMKGVHAVRTETGQTAVEVSSFLRAITDAPQHNQTTRFEVDYRTPGGVEKVLAITVSPIRSSVGAFLGSTCLITDRTQISSLARQMRVRENLASLGEMSAGIAHEFKNSLATISGYAQMLKGEPDETVSEFATRIQGTTENLTSVVTDFLNFARPQQLKREPIELRPVLEDCARETKVTLEFQNFPDRLVVNGDRTALRQVFSNLLRNAAEAARNNTPVRVTVRASATDTSVELSLHDNGTGIPEEALKNIFIPFFTTKPQGTGLGLALVHRIVTEHGGSIRAGNDLEGAVFTLSLPLQKPAAEKPATANPK
ncbi:PAS/PAC sensor signal transduction histidine kinase [Candidatus Koribacter versatilis Ellin345]|uniref:histidine kinase n=1 Tax=Koribacter versatilis (strain Ellin345) TaxID=204669 RepID=Q1IRA8_KORVE|nr:ATP-binding protein [Candidatus Koribacter versatilis]ABF40592.1 PAS/PAC sensor signal transduction histidine kinase [Candidatus Koribacter versatilis Ellin345]